MNEEQMKLEALRALVETIPAYEGALATLKAGILPSIVQSKWLQYGCWSSCRICRALTLAPGLTPICRLCPIGDGETRSACAQSFQRVNRGGKSIREANRAGETFTNLLQVIHPPLLNTGEMIAAFQARLDWIIDTAEKNGHNVWRRPPTKETDG